MNPKDRELVDRIYGQLGRVGHALAAPCRLELLDLLNQGPRTVEALAAECRQSVANTSQHLQVLRAARLVEADKKGHFVTYRVANDAVADFLKAFRGLAEDRLLEIRELVADFNEGRRDFDPVDRDGLMLRVAQGKATVLDVRPAEEYRYAHIAGAKSIPLAELADRLKEIPKNREVVAYCRGRYCFLATEAVELLRARGYRAIRLTAGVPEWRARGLPVATGTA